MGGGEVETQGRKQELEHFFPSQMAGPLNRHCWLKPGIFFENTGGGAVWTY